MCGIVGFSGLPDEPLLRHINALQKQRGPDGEGFLIDTDRGISLAMTRLSIIDAEGGAQPMSDKDGRIHVVFNGEIFNAPEIRASLEAGGARFASDHSDTEVLLQLYKRHGIDMLSHLNGMFAFVIFDERGGRLFGARDRFGIKPLYLSEHGGRLSFASELKTLLQLPWMRRAIDRQAVYHYLSFQSVPAPLSVISGVSTLEPGSFFVYELEGGKLQTAKYWTPRFDAYSSPEERELNDYVREELVSAVDRWVLSDVPVACSLSGGLDSAIVTGAYARSTPGLKTFSLGFPDAPSLDERESAHLTARMWATDHREFTISADEVAASLDDMIWSLDEPYAGGLPSWFVFREMASEVKVGLTGIGGDEIFGNYGKWMPIVSRRERLKRLLPWDRGPRWRFGSFYHPLYFTEADKAQILVPDATVELMPSEELVEQMWRRSPSQDPRDAIAFVDLQLQLPNEFLHMIDRFSMAHSLEARTPLLDHVFVEKMLAIPADRRTHPARLKGPLLGAAQGLVPDPARTIRKRGFVLPLREWLRGRLRPVVIEYLGPEALKHHELFRKQLWDDVVLPHLDGRVDNTQKVWTLLMFEWWRRTFDIET